MCASNRAESNQPSSMYSRRTTALNFSVFDLGAADKVRRRLYRHDGHRNSPSASYGSYRRPTSLPSQSRRATAHEVPLHKRRLFQPASQLNSESAEKSFCLGMNHPRRRAPRSDCFYWLPAPKQLNCRTDILQYSLPQPLLSECIACS